MSAPVRLTRGDVGTFEVGKRVSQPSVVGYMGFSDFTARAAGGRTVTERTGQHLKLRSSVCGSQWRASRDTNTSLRDWKKGSDTFRN